GDRPELRVEAEQRDQRVALDVEVLVRRDVLDRHRRDVPVAVDPAHLAWDEDADASLALELTRLVDRRFEGAAALAPVDDGDRVSRRVLEPEHPVERRVAAADDDAGAVAEDILLANEVMEALSLPRVDAVDPERAGLEGAVTRGDDQRPAQVRPAAVRRDGKELLAV